MSKDPIEWEERARLWYRENALRLEPASRLCEDFANVGKHFFDGGQGEAIRYSGRRFDILNTVGEALLKLGQFCKSKGALG